MALATAAQVAAILGRTFTPDETTRAEELIALAQTRIEGRLGRPAEEPADPIVETVDVAGRRSRLLLTNWPVASVDSVTEDGEGLTADTDYRLDPALGMLTRLVSGGWGIWAFGAGIVEVEYKPATIDELAALCAAIAARAFTAGEESAAKPAILKGLRQLTIGRWSATEETSAQADPVAAIALTEDDRATVDRWASREP